MIDSRLAGHLHPGDAGLSGTDFPGTKRFLTTRATFAVPLATPTSVAALLSPSDTVLVQVEMWQSPEAWGL